MRVVFEKVMAAVSGAVMTMVFVSGSLGLLTNEDIRSTKDRLWGAVESTARFSLWLNRETVIGPIAVAVLALYGAHFLLKAYRLEQDRLEELEAEGWF